VSIICVFYSEIQESSEFLSPSVPIVKFLISQSSFGMQKVAYELQYTICILYKILLFTHRQPVDQIVEIIREI